MGVSPTGNPGAGSGSTITLPASVANIEKVIAFLEGELEKRDCPVKTSMQICMAADEVMANIAMYAYAPGSGEMTVQFDYDGTGRTVSVTFTDSGIPFDPLAKKDPDVGLPAEERKIGGLGIFLVKKTMDEIRYRREGGKNILCIRKQI